jgi:hypothetical protein
MHFPLSPQANVATTPSISEQVKSYARWLTADTRRNVFSNYREEIKKYSVEALTPIRVSGREVSIFAPFCHKYSAQQTITRRQLCVLGLVGGRRNWAIPHHGDGRGDDRAVTVLYFVDLLMSFRLSARR